MGVCSLVATDRCRGLCGAWFVPGAVRGCLACLDIGTR
jgi:hypothetical protein